MSAERRLKKTHATVIRALYQSGQELQQRAREVQEAIEEQITAWPAEYGLDPAAQHHVEVRPGGVAYLIELPKPVEEVPEVAEEKGDDDGDGI